MSLIDSALSKNLLPDFVTRFGIRRLLKDRLNEIKPSDKEDRQHKIAQFINNMNSAPIAVLTEKANEQHYEVPPEFFINSLGPNLKYSCCLFENGDETLEQAELKMLELTAKRADLTDGQSVLELGCGWGSLTLFMAKKYPNSKITGVSNSKDQREHILNKAKQRGLDNIEIITCDMNDFNIDKSFDRVVSVEMFEHMRNYKQLLERVSRFLNQNGKLFIHIFVHKEIPYLFEVKDDSDWMSKYFFSGGMMPSNKLLYHFEDNFKLNQHWTVNGRHYQKTADKWLENTDKNKEVILKIFEQTYGADQALKWFSYWRIFFMSCSELWGYANGEEWFVSHYLLEKKD